MVIVTKWWGWVVIGEHCDENILGRCEGETSGCYWRTEAGFFGYGKQRP